MTTLNIKKFCKFELTKSKSLLFRPKKLYFCHFNPKEWLSLRFSNFSLKNNLAWLDLNRGDPVKCFFFVFYKLLPCHLTNFKGQISSVVIVTPDHFQKTDNQLCTLLLISRTLLTVCIHIVFDDYNYKLDSQW